MLCSRSGKQPVSALVMELLPKSMTSGVPTAARWVKNPTAVVQVAVGVAGSIPGAVLWEQIQEKGSDIATAAV